MRRRDMIREGVGWRKLEVSFLFDTYRAFGIPE